MNISKNLFNSRQEEGFFNKNLDLFFSKVKDVERQLDKTKKVKVVKSGSFGPTIQILQEGKVFTLEVFYGNKTDFRPYFSKQIKDFLQSKNYEIE